MLCWMCKLELSHLAVPFTRCWRGAWFCSDVERVPGIVLFANYPSSHTTSSVFSKQLVQVFLGMPTRTMQDYRCLCGKKMPYQNIESIYIHLCEKDYCFQGFYSLMYWKQYLSVFCWSWDTREGKKMGTAVFKKEHLIRLQVWTS